MSYFLHDIDRLYHFMGELDSYGFSVDCEFEDGNIMIYLQSYICGRTKLVNHCFDKIFNDVISKRVGIKWNCELLDYRSLDVSKIDDKGEVFCQILKINKTHEDWF